MSNLVGRENVYVCKKCGRHLVTVDRDEGTTPFMVPCEKTPGCKGWMESSFYPTAPKPSHIGPATHEWYTPLAEERRRLGQQTREHVERGGLLLRPISRTPSPESRE